MVGVLQVREDAAVELEVTGVDHLYLTVADFTRSEAFYDRETFDRLYNVPALTKVKERYDPDARLTGLYEKAVTRR